MPWQAISSSVRGTRNTELNKPCQDYAAHRIFDETHTIIGAAADGMGSAKYSDIGAKLATKVAIAELAKKGVPPELGNHKKIQLLFEVIVKTVKRELEKKASSCNCSTEDLACTLLAFIATPDWLAAMQIGDGFIVVRALKEDYKILFQPDKGEYENITTSIVSSEALNSMQFCFQANSYEFICVATDGIENIALIRSGGWEPFNKFFLPLEKHLLSQEETKKKTLEISSLLDSDNVNKITSDDKTLLICVHKSAD